MELSGHRQFLYRGDAADGHTVMDGTGAALVNLSFAAYGGRRQGAGWNDDVPINDLTEIAATTRRGFTGHEALDNVTAIHMNGRAYDPDLGRFLSADPVYVGNLADPQSLNPYSYGGGNPLNATDPTGFCHGHRICIPVDGSVVERTWAVWGGTVYDAGTESGQYELPQHGDFVDHRTGPVTDLGNITNRFNVIGRDSGSRVWDSLSRGNRGGSAGHDGGGGGGRGGRSAGGTGDATEKNSDSTSQQGPQSQGQSSPCSAGSAPNGLWRSNSMYRSNRNPSQVVTVDASQLTVKQTTHYNAHGTASGHVTGWERSVYGTVTLQRGSSGAITLRPDRYDFDMHDVIGEPNWLYELARNIETAGGYLVATFGGASDFLGFVAGSGTSTPYTTEFVCSPQVMQ